MENKVGTSVATTAYGNKLDAPIEYGYKWSIYESDEELVAAKDELTLEEQRKARNNERQANARQKALQAALDGAGIIKPTIENDSQERLKSVFKSLMATGKYSEEKARALASDTLGEEWSK